jgi:hypothetical protein
MAFAVDGPLGSVGIGVPARSERGVRSRGVRVEVDEDDGSGHLSPLRESDGIASQDLACVPAKGIDVIALVGRDGHHHVQHPIAIHISDGGRLINAT